MTPGRLLYLGYHAPLAALSRCRREGGPLEQWRDHRAAAEMRRTAWELSPIAGDGSSPLEFHLLTGRAYVEQSAFCVWSFAQAAQRDVAPVFHDDGTLSPAWTRLLRMLFPRARFVSDNEFQRQLERHLPAVRFPSLRERLAVYPHLRKLVAPHLAASGWKLVLDSDLLFFRRPDFLLEWLESPPGPLHLVDVVESYGYPRALLEEMAGTSLPRRVNVGLCGMRSESLDWERLESWCRRLISAAGTHYLLEQALTALLLAGQEAGAAPPADYLCLPDREETLHPRAVMHHYVAESKRWYFRIGWRSALRTVAFGLEPQAKLATNNR